MELGRTLRIFLSSPGDVVEERELARAFIKDALPVEPFIRGKASFDVISWDDPDAPVAMPANLTPQQAINLGLPRPCDCDIVVVIIWSRMGTPLPDDVRKLGGERYVSGTEWEYENALAAAGSGCGPVLLLYRCTEEPTVKLSDRDLDAKRGQYEQVENFFARFHDADGSLAGSVHSYAAPSDFQRLLRQHLLQVVQRLLQPAAGLAWSSAAPAYQSRIEAFLDEYLKSESGPVPFGGRDPAMAKLDAWLLNDSGPRRCLVTGPAGRGKSALLVRWIQRLQQQGSIASGIPETAGWHLVLVPISIRFGTNAQQVFYQGLAERLAMVAEQDLEKPVSDATGFYADKVRELLNELGRTGRRVLVILDGIDEALRGEFDATIIPRILPPTTRVLISARWQIGDRNSLGWQQRLDWVNDTRCTTLDLDTLDADAIREVLAAMGAATHSVAADDALVHRLAELTEGEPLLLRYYASDLWLLGERATRITLADLDQLRPGFGAYFDRWLELQQRAWREAGEPVDDRTVDAILMILAFAHGPLEGADLLALIKRFPGASVSFRPQHLLAPLRRFVIGEGSREKGYVLTHPKIGEHLQTERFRQERRLVQQAYLDWGKECVGEANRAAERANEAPPYLIQFYRRHMQDSRVELSDYLSLVENGWRLAWEYLEGGQEGFASDVRAVLAVIRESGPLAHLGDQLRCILTLASIRSLGYNVPRELILSAVRSHVLSAPQALQLAGFMRDRFQYVLTLGALPNDFESEPARQQELLGEALVVAKTLDNATMRAKALCGLAPQLDARLLAEAAAAGEMIRDEHARASALVGFAPHLTGPQIARALRVAEEIQGSDARATALGGLSGYLRSEQRTAAVAGALSATAAIDDEYNCAKVICSLAPVLAGADLLQLAASARAIRDDYFRIWAVAGVAPFLPDEQRAEVLSEALAAATKIDNEGARVRALCRLVHHLVGEQRTEALNAALAAAKKLGSIPQVQTLCVIAAHLTDEGRGRVSGEALPVAKGISSEWDRAGALRALAALLTDDQFDDALAAARAIGNENSRARALGGIASHLKNDEQRRQTLSEALLVATAIRNDDSRTTALSELASQLTGEQLAVALAAAKAIRDEEIRAAVFGGLTVHLTGEQRSKNLNEALAAATAIGEEEVRANALNELAPRLTGEQRDDALGEALEAAKAIRDEEARAETLRRLAPHLNAEQLTDALATAKAIRNEAVRGYAINGDPFVMGQRTPFSATFLGALAPPAIWELIFSDTFPPLIAYLSEDRQQAEDAIKAVRDEHIYRIEQNRRSWDERHATSDHHNLSGDLMARLSANPPRHRLAPIPRARSEPPTGSTGSPLTIHEALAALEADPNNSDHVSALVVLAPDLADDTENLREVFAITKAMYSSNRINVLFALALHQKGKQLAEILEALKSADNESNLANTLSYIISGLKGESSRKALAILLTIGDVFTRPSLLKVLIQLTSPIAQIGGEPALLGLQKGVSDTARWYP